ncbi:MAG: hypothetical protein K2M36_00065 [Clostridia bacterium]|nr:hypothetical protein [Clostridia bacterium]
MKEMKRIFLFVKQEVSDKQIMKSVNAISEDEKHKFEFELNQDDYAKTVKEMKAEFERFCKEECGFDDCAYCDIWLLDDTPLDKVDFKNDIRIWLGHVDWCCYQCVEFNYNNKNAHIVNALPFEEFKSAHGYDESKEPLETKRIYDIYKREIDKTEFSEQEVENMVKFISDNRYSKLFEAIGRNYPMRFKLSDTLCNLYMADRAEYDKQIKGLTEELMRRVTVMVRRLVEIISEIPDAYSNKV